MVVILSSGRTIARQFHIYNSIVVEDLVTLRAMFLETLLNTILRNVGFVSMKYIAVPL